MKIPIIPGTPLSLEYIIKFMNLTHECTARLSKEGDKTDALIFEYVSFEVMNRIEKIIEYGRPGKEREFADFIEKLEIESKFRNTH